MAAEKCFLCSVILCVLCGSVVLSAETPGLGAGGTPALPATPELLVHGKELFANNCTACHGVSGKGDGEAAYLLNPKPRNLTSRSFRLTSNTEGSVQADDIFRTLTRGMPGSAMPSWEILSENDRWALAHFVKSLSKPDKKPPTPVIAGVEPPVTAESVARGKEQFMKACAPCHGPEGRGNGVQEQVDSDGFPTRPRDLTRGIFKGARDGQQLYYRISIGMPGSPMPSHSGSFSQQQIWELVQFVQSLSEPAVEQRNLQKLQTLTAKRSAAPISDDPADKVWQEIPATYLALMPLWWRDNRPEGVQVRAAHDGAALYLHVSWSDATPNQDQTQAQNFRDGAAVQFTAADSPPFLSMGGKSMADVRIWHWKADRQKDLDGQQDVQTAHPGMHVDTYRHEIKGSDAAEKMGVDYGGFSDVKDIDVTKLDPRFITALGVNNPVSNVGGSAAESLTAHGIGTLGFRPIADQGLSAKGTWNNGMYSVVFRRPLKQVGEKAINLVEGKTYYVAFACWDGQAGDRNGQKSVTIWHRLEIGK